ncbi:CheY-like chemotaxis protein [Methanolinea mesophila]|uniref:response regulator n=1 Tax=Methanolinea mesophila TaxID=547055 RepID=UPI001AE30DFB|nr:response regulator [Methanolinea mesophila]MBP1929923.1 CheY-like chemotaxis protein [Methanolinea mesophila]
MEHMVHLMKTVLLVDDGAELVSLYCRMLSMLGYMPLAANGSRECLERIDEKVPDAILLDVMMVPVDGWETLRQIRKKKECLLTPVLMLTARSPQPREILQCGDLFDGYIMKPVTKSNLERELDSLWNRCTLIRTNMEKFRNLGIPPEKARDYAVSMRTCVSMTHVMNALNVMNLPSFLPAEPDTPVIDEITGIEERIRYHKKKIREYHAILG